MLNNSVALLGPVASAHGRPRQAQCRPMKRLIPLIALACRARRRPGRARRQARTAPSTPSPSATVKIPIGHLHGGKAQIMSTVPVTGTVRPYAPGQRVEVSFFLNGDRHRARDGEGAEGQGRQRRLPGPDQDRGGRQVRGQRPPRRQPHGCGGDRPCARAGGSASPPCTRASAATSSSASRRRCGRWATSPTAAAASAARPAAASSPTAKSTGWRAARAPARAWSSAPSPARANTRSATRTPASTSRRRSPSRSSSSPRATSRSPSTRSPRASPRPRP